MQNTVVKKRISGWWYVAIWVTTILVTIPFWYSAVWFPIVVYIAASVSSFLIHRRNSPIHTTTNSSDGLLNMWNDAHLQTIDWLMDGRK